MNILRLCSVQKSISKKYSKSSLLEESLMVNKRLGKIWLEASVLTLRRRVCHSWHIKVFLSFSTAQRKLLCQNDEKISPLLKTYGFYENTVSNIGLLWKS